ncbi:MAG: DUF4493 domain-containing protein [Bacteroidales bacterium]|nr:DUF4493 domain-containing protein [Bacteroidales bacterium]
MKRFVALGFSFALALTSCNLMTDYDIEQSGNADCVISLSLAEPVKAFTKASAQDTNNYHLSITNVSGESVYSGAYGSKPEEIKVVAGTYEIVVVSDLDGAPAFSHPRYGDTQTVVVSNGEKTAVALVCKQINCGIRLTFLEKFTAKYPDGYIRISNGDGFLDYRYDETRYAFFSPGNTNFSLVSDGTVLPILSRVLEEGVQLRINLEASTNESQSTFTIAVDTTATYLTENLIVGGHYDGEDGSSAVKAYSVESAREHVGETVWIWGYIVAGYNSTSASSLSFNAPFASASSMAIASSATANDATKCMSVTLASGSQIRNEANLVDHPEVLGRKIFIKGTIVDSYLGLVGIKPVKEFEW